ncbi:Protein of unknown function (DUF2971) [Fodinibius salinus]|uniref:DUF2971 domain-containing protein n=1 Tax=Fodinibius salinus TaxID=860790 RepID=A0A5D3YKP3_9BACT|nr:DUF2971 domain-containing protein [Fodinibius salinus]TYP93526.1 Protein of unknown function (DUF2971) [Fodinibius salinus]
MTKRKWQKHFIRDVFSLKSGSHDSFSKIVFKNPELVKSKDNKIPDTLFKFYAPTSSNILDVRKRRLWLSHPNSFNDPFDSHVGVDYKNYEKHLLLKHIDKTGFIAKSDGFSKKDYRRIADSKPGIYPHALSENEEYSSVISKMRRKSDDFKKEITKIRRRSKKEVSKKIDKIRETNIRVASFANLQSKNYPPARNDLERMIQMWAHYSDNHKGFCVEYDISSLKPANFFKMYENKNGYESYSSENNINLLILAGLFPIIYSSNRVNIPRTKLEKLTIDKDGNLINKVGIDEILYKAFITKSTKWSYEKEWRIILDGRISNYFNNKIPFPFIKHIYLGSRMKPKVIDDLIEIADELNVEVTLMDLNEKKFTLEHQNINSYKWDKEKSSWHNPLL